MGLQIWLPFNGSTENKGIEDLVLTSGTPTYSDGKIGKCLSDGALTYTSTNNILNTITTDNLYSIAVWVKYTYTSTGWIYRIGSSKDTARGVWATSDSTTIEWAYSGSGVYMPTSINIIDGEWHHVTFTVNGANVKLYVDGTYQSEITNGKTNNITDKNTMFFDGTLANINDFRLYDHCLSAKEVHEISKGLILHYPMNNIDGIIGGKNILAGTSTSVTRSVNTTNYIAQSLYYTTNRLYLSDLGYEVGDILTVSFDWNISDATTYGYCRLEAYGLTSSSSSAYIAAIKNPAITFSSSNTSGHFEYSFPLTSTLLNTNRLYVRVDNSVLTLNISNLKLEKGDKATPWTPAPEDVAYLDIYDKTIYDCSGFGNNGNYVDIDWDTDTPIGRGSYIFNGYSSYINAGTGAKVTDEITVTGWIKNSLWSEDSYRFASCTEGGGWNISYYNTIGFSVYIYGVGYKIAKASYTFSNDSWHMLTGTYDGYSIKIYVDGVLCATNTPNTTKTKIGYHSTNSIIIGAEASTGATAASPFLDGNIADFRIYATALSASDIAELYNTRFSLADNGNFS